MRLACLLVLIAACDFQPPTTKAVPAPKPAPPATPNATPPGPPPEPAAGSATGSAAASGNTPACTEMAIKIARVLIDDTTDLAQKAALEQDRAKIIKKVAETCTRDRWSPQVLDCLAGAKTQADTRECTKDLKAPS